MSLEPQSIVHQIIRLEQRIARAIQGRRQRKCIVSPITEKDTIKINPMKESPDDATIDSFHIQDQHNAVESHLSQIEHNDPTYPTLNEDEATSELFSNLEGFFLVHFFVEGSPVSKAIDKQMKEISGSSFTNTKYLRMDARLAPNVTKTLGIDKNQPTVAAVSKGGLVNKISAFGSVECLELRQWAFTVELLSSK